MENTKYTKGKETYTKGEETSEMREMQESFTTVSEAIEDLKKKGYTEDFNLCDTGVENKSKKKIHSADELNVVKFYRFEGFSNPEDNMVLYVIETNTGEKGVLLDAYGAYSGSISDDMLRKLNMNGSGE